MDEGFWLYEMLALDPSWMESPSSGPKGRLKEGWGLSSIRVLTAALSWL